MGASNASVLTGLNPTEVNTSNPLPLFIIQASIIVAFCYILNLLLRRLKQPRVVSEVIAGILLGPSVLGRIPGFLDTIFNPASLPYLNLVSNLGLVLFLFLVGLELDPVLVIRRARFAVGISFAGIALPFGVGAAVSYVLYEEMGPETTVGFGQFLLFTGVAMSITAFPVLARILAEQKLLTTKVGFLTICAGAVGDIAAWVLLALVVSIINSGSKLIPLYVILLSIAWILILVFAFRPLFHFMIRVTKSHDEPSQSMIAFTMFSVLASAFVTDIIGIHAIFGSFLVGLIIPHDSGFAHGVTKRIEDLVSVILLPIYFALSGLKTQVGLLNTAKTWGLVILVTFAACFGKIVGSTGAAKLQGMEWRESLAIGFLMNCKGLIELIVLNIGLDAGVINPRVFVIMIAMCLITTCMTTPCVVALYPPHYQRAVALRNLAKERKARGDVEQPESSLEEPPRSGYMLCLDKIQNLPAMMTLLKMFHHTVQHHQQQVQQLTDSNVSDYSGSTHGPAGGAPFVSNLGKMPNMSEIPSLVALRLLHLTDRSSSVLMAATERAEVLRRDTLITVLQAFAKLNSISLQPRMTLSTDPDDFANSIVDEAHESGADVIIFPWNSTALPDPPSAAADAEGSILARPTVTSNTQVVTRLLNSTAQTGLTTAILVDREFGSSGHFMNLMVILYGSYDDEAALKLAAALSHNRDCFITIVRVETTKTLTVPPAVATTGVQHPHADIDQLSIDGGFNEKSPLPEDDKSLVQKYFPHRAMYGDIQRKSFRKSTASNLEGIEHIKGENLAIHTVSTIQDAIGLAKSLLTPKDLLVLGRGVTSKKPRPSGTPAGVGGAADGAHTPGIAISHSIPTWLSAHSTGQPKTPNGEIDNPLGGSGGGEASSSGLRNRHLRHQPSSRDLHHSNMTITTILGVVSHAFLTSELTSCLLSVQSGYSPTAGVQLSRIASAVPGSVRGQPTGAAGSPALSTRKSLQFGLHQQQPSTSTSTSGGLYHLRAESEHSHPPALYTPPVTHAQLSLPTAAATTGGPKQEVDG